MHLKLCTLKLFNLSKYLASYTADNYFTSFKWKDFYSWERKLLYFSLCLHPGLKLSELAFWIHSITKRKLIIVHQIGNQIFQQQGQ